MDVNENFVAKNHVAGKAGSREKLTRTLNKGLLNSILVGSNQMPLTAWKHTERNRHRDRKKFLMKRQGLA